MKHKVHKQNFFILGGAFIFFTIVGFWIFSSIDGEKQDDTKSIDKVFPSSKPPEEFTYKDMMALREEQESNYPEKQEERIAHSPIESPIEQPKENTTEDYTYRKEQQQVKNVQKAIKNSTYNKPSRSKTPTAKTIQENSPVTQNHTQPLPKKARFFGSYDEEKKPNPLYVVTHEEQTIEDGDYVTLRLTQDATIDGKKVPAHTFIYGQATFTHNRIFIDVPSIKVANNPVPIELTAYDAEDGLKGVRVNTGYAKKARIAKEGIEDAADDATSAYIPSIPVIGSITRAAGNILKGRESSPKILLTKNYKLLLK